MAETRRKVGFLADRDVMDGLAILPRSTDPNDKEALLKILERIKEGRTCLDETCSRRRQDGLATGRTRL